MARPPLGPMAMDRIVKFRLREDELTMLRSMAKDENISDLMRGLIHDEHKRRKDGK